MQRRSILIGRDGRFVDDDDQPLSTAGTWQLHCETDVLDVTAQGDDSRQVLRGNTSYKLRGRGTRRTNRFRGELRLSNGQEESVTLELADGLMQVNQITPESARVAIEQSL